MSSASEIAISNPACMQHSTNHLGQLIGYPVTGWQIPSYPALEPMHGNFCRVEPLKPTLHAEDLYVANSLDNEGKMWTYLPYGPFVSIESYHAWLDEAAAANDKRFYAIIDQTSNRAVGLAAYLRIDPESGSIEIGNISFSPLLKRSRAATEAIYLMLKQVFQLGYRRCEWKCNALNSASRAAAQRLGFSYEGIFRQAAVIKGHNRDTAWYAMIDGEWPAMQAAFLQWLDSTNFDETGQQKIRLSNLTRPLLKHYG